MSKNQNKHDMYIDNLINLIEKEEVIFKDQYGVEHKVFSNKENEFMYKESVYFKNHEEPTLHNPNFPCANINKDNFKPLCDYKMGEDKILKDNQCFNCLHSNSKGNYDKLTSFLKDNTLTPDIGIGENGKFKYWIEVVNSHCSTDYKRRFIKDKDWIVLEVHINHIEKTNSKHIKCFNISNIEDNEYEYIKEIYDLCSSLYNYTGSKKMRNYLKEAVRIDETSTADNNDIFKYVDSIFYSLGRENFINGQTLDYEKFIDFIVKEFNITDRDKLGRKVSSYIREKHESSILNLHTDFYPLELLQSYGFKKRKSIIYKKLADDFNKALKKHKASSL